MFQYFSNINLRKCAQDTVTEFAMHDAVFVSYHGGFCYDNCGCVTYALCLISALFFFQYDISGTMLKHLVFV